MTDAVNDFDGKLLAVTGGVGGAKLCLGLSKILSPKQCAFVVNVGDDFTHFGLHIAPDIDTLTYTLSGLSNQIQGWGREGETWHFIEAMKKLGGDAWFNLGDADLAMHVFRSECLKSGMRLSEVSAKIAERLGIQHAIMPVTDDSVPTVIETDSGPLPFQEYFVKLRCEPTVNGFAFANADAAQISPELRQWLGDPALKGVVICPSNPYISIDPLLAAGGFGRIIKDLDVPVVAVSPIVHGAAVKGPTAKIMTELQVPSTALAVAEHYRDLLDGFVVDEQDAALAAQISEIGLNTIAAQTVMVTLADKIHLAKVVMDFVRQIGAE
ncbi:MAG: 2-phospho-L-lactate transferase [Pseudomonadota bacterium]